MRKRIRLLVLILLAIVFLGPKGLITQSRLQLHAEGEFISDAIRETGVHYELLQLIRVWLWVRPRKVVDVGANLGNHSNFFGLKNAECTSFEPSKANFTLLKKNLVNGIAHNVALGSKPGLVEILVSQESMGNTHIRGAMQIESDHSASSELVELRTLDSFELEDVDLVKIDVEGFEMEVLEGAERLFEKSMPSLWIEIHEELTLQGAKMMYTRTEIFEWLRLRGYSKFRKIDKTNFLFVHELR